MEISTPWKVEGKGQKGVSVVYPKFPFCQEASQSTCPSSLIKLSETLVQNKKYVQKNSTKNYNHIDADIKFPISDIYK